MDLTAGKHVDVDLRMELQPLFKVSGMISGGGNGDHAQISDLQLRRTSALVNSSE